MTRPFQTKKRMSVGDFVAARTANMEETAQAFLNGNVFPEAVYIALAGFGLDPRSAILVRYVPEPGCCSDYYEGLLLTSAKRFLKFQVDLFSDEVSVHDVTESTDIDERKPGIGTSDGFLALQLLEKMERAGKLSTSKS